MLKVGTTNDLERRRKEHNRNYRKAEEHRMKKKDVFEYDWHLKLSKYNTLRFEDRTRQKWQEMGIGEYVRNDRFCCAEKPIEVEITIRKTYKVALQQGLLFFISKFQERPKFLIVRILKF